MKMAGLQQTLNHRDTSHADDALLRLNKLRQEGILCDVTVLVQGKEFKAHKAVLASCSDYFLNALCGGKSTAIVRVDRAVGQMTLELEHVTVRGFTPLLEYAYTSNLQVNASDVIDVLQAASFLQMSKISTACSEFMRSNILWSQSLPRLAAGLPTNLLNGKVGNKEEDLRAVAAAMAARGITTDVSSLFTNSAISAAAGRALGQPPMLIPMGSMSYEAGLQQWAANMAGRTNFLSRVSTAHRTPTMEPTNNAITATSIASLTNPSLGPWPQREVRDRRETPSPRENGSRVNPRKSGSFKMETQSDGEAATGQHNDAASPNGSSNSEPMEDSWQALQKLYSIRAIGASSPRDGGGNHRSGSNTPVDIDTNNNVHSPVSRDHSRPHSVENTSANLNSNNNNNMKGLKDGMAEFIGKMKANLLSSENIARLSPAAAAAAAMAARGRLPVTSVQSALLQQQQLLAQHGSGNSENGQLPVPELPVVPPNGQYMSVRRRTLQSNVPKPHQCQICGSRFTRFHNLKQHIKLHSGIKPYECDECGKRFTRNYTLRLHKMKHVGIRNFRCGTCDATFTSLGEFRAHLRITMHSHTGIGALDGSPSRNSNASPEDMTTDQLNNGHKQAVISRYSAFDPSMLGIGATSMSMATGHSQYNPLVGTSTDGGSVGADSPNISERSMSPQDLSTKSTQRVDKKNLYDDVNVDESEITNVNADKIDRECGSVSPHSDRFISSGAESANKSAVSDDADDHDLVIDHQDDVTNDRPMSLVVDASA